MLERVLLAGYGGQGALFAGKLLAYAGMLAGREVAWMPSYGPEMRGGTANCSVTVSDRVIASAIVDEPDSALILNRLSLDKFLSTIKPQGLLLVNSSVVEKRKIRDDVCCMWIDAEQIAQDAGSSKAANMVMLGAYLERKNFLMWDPVHEALKKLLEGKKEAFWRFNLRALECGREVVKRLQEE